MKSSPSQQNNRDVLVPKLGRGWYVWRVGWWIWGMLVVGLVGCFDPVQTLQRESLQLILNGLHKDTRFLRVELTVCDGSRIVGVQRVFEHPVVHPFGNETFLLPRSLKNATVDMIVTAYRSEARIEMTQHVRQRWILQDQDGILPTIILQPGPLVEGYRRCEIVKVPVEEKKNSDVPEVISVGVSGGGGSTTEPSRYAPPWSPTPKPLPSVPSLASLHDDLSSTVEASPAAPFRLPIASVASQGRWIAVADATAEVRVHDIFTGAQVTPPYTVIPDGCSPQSLDIQGDVLVIVCSGNDYSRVFFRSLDTRSQEYSKSDENKQGRFYGLEEGFDVGKEPLSVKAIGHLVMVLNPKELYIFRMDQVNQSVKPILLSSLGTIESPSSFAVSGQFLFIADRNNHGDIHQFRLYADGERIERVQILTMEEPSHALAVNERYVAAIVGQNNAWAVKVLVTPFVATSLRIKLEKKPEDIALLSHTLWVLQDNPPHLVMYDLRTKTTSSHTLPRSFQRLVVTGEKIVLVPKKVENSTKDWDTLGIMSVQTRKNHIRWKTGTHPRSMFLVDSTLWVFDPLAQRLRQLSQLNRPDEVPQPYVQSSFSLKEADVQGWMGVYKNFLFFTGDNRMALYVRQLPPRLERSPWLVTKTVLPIQGGRVIQERNKLYLLLWDQSTASPQWMEFSLTPQATTTDELLRDPGTQQNQEPVLRTFPYRNWKPVDVYPSSSSTFIIANRSQFLYQVGVDLQVQGKPIALDGTWLSMMPLRDQLAVAYQLPNSGSQIVTIDLATFTKTSTIPTYSDSEIYAMNTFGQYLLVTDRFNDIVMICDPSVSTVCSYQLVGCGPSALAVIGKDHADARIITANDCDDTLSLLPLLP